MGRTAAATTDRTPAAAGPLTPKEAGRWLSDLFEEHSRMVYGVCRVLLRDPQDAEDASQQTFLSAHRSLLAGTRPQDPAAWLGTIARNACRERLRARATVPLALVADPAASVQVEDVTARREEIEALCAALAELPHQQREALVLREFYGLSYDEVRAALGVTDSAVESLIFRARKRLQKELRPARIASGALVLPIALHDSLARAVPGFAGTHRVGILAKLTGGPVAAKLAAATLAVTVAGVVGTTAIQRQQHDRAPTVIRQVAATISSTPNPLLGNADPVATPGRPAQTSAHVAAPHLKRNSHHHSRVDAGPSGADQDDQGEPASPQGTNQDQTSSADDMNDDSSNSAQDSSNADSGGTGGDGSSGADGNAGDSTGDGDG